MAATAPHYLLFEYGHPFCFPVLYSSWIMEVKAVVWYAGKLAHYVITPENSGVYYARLLTFEEQSGPTPPANLILVRGMRHWVGSANEPYLVDELGKVIEYRIRGGDPHRV